LKVADFHWNTKENQTILDIEFVWATSDLEDVAHFLNSSLDNVAVN